MSRRPAVKGEDGQNGFPPSPTGGDLITDRLVLRPWTAGEVDAVLNGARLAHWAEDTGREARHSRSR